MILDSGAVLVSIGSLFATAALAVVGFMVRGYLQRLERHMAASQEHGTTIEKHELRLETLEKRPHVVDARFAKIEQEIDVIRNAAQTAREDDIRWKATNDVRLADIERGQRAQREEYSELRKEVRTAQGEILRRLRRMAGVRGDDPETEG